MSFAIHYRFLSRDKRMMIFQSRLLPRVPFGRRTQIASLLSRIANLDLSATRPYGALCDTRAPPEFRTFPDQPQEAQWAFQ